MTKAKSFSRDAMRPVSGTLAVMQYCLPAQLEIDPRYQRSIDNTESQALIAEIALSWHWGRAQVLTVARRDGKLFVVDGQHRLAAARLRGDIQQLPCLIEEFSDVAEEAALFNDLNSKRRPVSAVDKFRAALVAGDAECVAVGAALERAGLSLAPHSNPTAWKPGQVANIGGIRAAWRTNGAAATELALTLLADAFAGKVLTYAGTIFPGLAAVCAGPDGKGVIGDDELRRLLAVLKSKTQGQWRTAMLQDMATSGDGRMVSMAKVLRAAMAEKPAANVARTAPVVATGGPAPIDRFERRAKGDQFCQQCDKLVAPAAANRCQSQWCKLRDLAA